MSKLNVDQKTIFDLLSDKKADFLIPDYQRPYAWNEEQCQALWDDIFSFSFPGNDYEAFDENEEYFLGSIVTYKNENGKSEVIDGQQRLTTLMLILRAFYDKFANMQDKNSKLTRERIEKCIWKTDTFGSADKSTLKIDSEVANDNDKEEFLDLLRTGEVKHASKTLAEKLLRAKSRRSGDPCPIVRSRMGQHGVSLKAQKVPIARHFLGIRRSRRFWARLPRVGNLQEPERLDPFRRGSSYTANGFNLRVRQASIWLRRERSSLSGCEHPPEAKAEHGEMRRTKPFAV